MSAYQSFGRKFRNAFLRRASALLLVLMLFMGSMPKTVYATGSSEEMRLLHPVLPEGTLAEGRAFTISGLICSDYLIRSVSVAVYNEEDEYQFGVEKDIRRKVFSLYSIDAEMAFSRLKAGDYYYEITAEDFVSDMLWSGSFSVRASDVTGTDVTYPKNKLTERRSFSCRGTVDAGSGISEVTLSVTSLTGIEQFSATAEPDAESFDLHDLDSEMTFRKLKPGRYIYRVAVLDGDGITTYLTSRSFEVGGEEEPRVYAETGALSLLGRSYEELDLMVRDLNYYETADEDVWYANGYYSEFGEAYCQFTFYDTEPGDPEGTVSVVWFNDINDAAMQIAGDIYTTMLYSNLSPREGLSELTYVGRWDVKDEYAEGVVAYYDPEPGLHMALCFRGEEVTDSAPLYAASISIDEAYEPAAEEDTDPAAEEDADSSEEKEDAPGREPLKVSVGDRLEFGSFEQNNVLYDGPEPITWRVLYLTEDGTKALMISEYSLENMQFDENSADQTWIYSTLRAWLHNVFYAYYFTDTEKNAVCEVSAYDTFAFTEASPDSGDWVFCLSQADVERLFSSVSDRQAKNSAFAEAQMKQKMLGSWFYPNTEAEVEAKVREWNLSFGENCSWWWLKDPAGTQVNATGEIKTGIDRRDLNSVRPAIWVDLTKLGD